MFKIKHKVKMLLWLSFLTLISFAFYKVLLSGQGGGQNPNQVTAVWSLLLLSNLFLLYKFNKLQRLNFYLEGSLDALEMPVTTTDMKMKWVFINKVTETLLAQHNLDKQSVIGKHCSNWKADICETENCGVNCLRSGKPRTHYNQALPGQSSIYMQVDTHYITDDSGKQIGHVEIVSNVDALKQLKDVVTILTPTSESLYNLSLSMAANSEEVSTKSQSLTASSEQMAASMQNASAAMEQSSTNVNMVASAGEEMTATINEIAENTEKARSITEGAVEHASETSEQVDKLGDSVGEIGKVVETIQEISEQVNLLALNATIEAARAGDAGKGFAVVANEIKELAKQTSEAAGQIKERVGTFRSTTEGTVKSISTISQVVGDINNIVSAIATALEEQTATTSEISSNIAQASQGMAEVNENVAQTAMVSSSIAQDLSLVHNAVNMIASGSVDVKSNAGTLADLTRKLDKLVNHTL